MMRPIYLEQSAIGASNPILMDWRNNFYTASLGVVLSDTPSMTYSIEYTLDPIHDPLYTGTPTWVEFTEATDQTGDINLSNISPVIAIRLNITTYVSGTARLQILMAG